jgi:membrane fusion protein, heavy metal efflux system
MKNHFDKIKLVLLVSIIFTGVAAASPGAHGPNGEHLDAPSTASPSGLSRLPDGSVNIPKQAQRRMEIRTSMVAENEHARTVTLNGKVSIDPNAGGHVQAPFSGRIDAPAQGFPVLGQAVKKGQVLAQIKPLSDGLSIGAQQSQLAEIKAKLTLAQQHVARMEALEGAVPDKDIQAARAELQALRGQDKAISGSVFGQTPLTAPANGVISKSSVLNGQVVEAREELFQVVDLTRLLIEASVGDANIASQIKAGSIQGLESVKLQFLGAGRSLVDGVLPLTFRAISSDKNAAIPLAVGQPVTVTAQLNSMVKGIRLPSEAIVRNPSNEFVVWIKSGAERFIAQPVQYQSVSATEVVITKGLASDNRVVVSGAALINQIR